MKKRIIALFACIILIAIVLTTSISAMTLNTLTTEASYNGMLYDKAQFRTGNTTEYEDVISIDLPQTIPPIPFIDGEYKTINDTYTTSLSGGVGTHSLFNTLYITPAEEGDSEDNTLHDAYDARHQFRVNETTSYVINDRRFIDITLQSTNSKVITRLTNFITPKIYFFANSDIDLIVKTTVSYQHLYYDKNENGDKILVIGNRDINYNTSETSSNGVISADLYGDIANDVNQGTQNFRCINQIYTTIRISYDNNDYSLDNDLLMFRYRYYQAYEVTQQEYWDRYFPNGVNTDEGLEPELRLGQFLSKTLNGFFQTQLFGTFSIGDILIACIGIGVLFAVLKYFAGG